MVIHLCLFGEKRKIIFFSKILNRYCLNLMAGQVRVNNEQGGLNNILFGLRREKACLWRFANNTGADQPVHPHSLISAFVIRFLESIICKLAAGEA